MEGFFFVCLDFILCVCFVSIYVPYACLMLAEVGIGHRIPWTLGFRMDYEPLCGIEPGPLQEHPLFFAAEPFLLPSTPSF